MDGAGWQDGVGAAGPGGAPPALCQPGSHSQALGREDRAQRFPPRKAIPLQAPQGCCHSPSVSLNFHLAMNKRILSILATTLLLAATLGHPALGAYSPAKISRPAIYDENADGAKQIADALAVAKKENKRVLLQFGANWCVWCHRLHGLFESDADIAARLKEAFVVVLVDVNKGHNGDVDNRYGHPTHFGLPTLVVLHADGKALVPPD